MKRPYLLIATAWLIHAISWFLPVIRQAYGADITIRGWEAFLAAFGAFWPRGDDTTSRFQLAIAAISAVATILFVLVSPWIVRRASNSFRRASAWVALAAFLIHANWLLFFSPDGSRSDFGLGYYFWWFSFALLALGLFDLSGAKIGSSISHAGPTHDLGVAG